MTDALDVFSLNAVTLENAWLHGQSSARAWFSGSLRAEDGLDFSGEFDAQASGRVGADVARALASVQAEATGSAHAGLRLQVGLPLDLFAGAGIVARLRAEASVSGQLTGTATLTLGALTDAVLSAVPPEGRPYAQILLEEARISAGAWARGSFAVMASAELVSTVALFPPDGSPPGMTAHLRYAYAWGYGGGWGTVVNVGLDPDILVPRLRSQLSVDLQRRVVRERPADDLEGWLLSLTPTLLPALLQAVVDVARTSATDESADLDDVLSSFVFALRPVFISWLSEALARASGDALARLGVGHLDDVARRVAWDAIDALTDERVRGAADRDDEVAVPLAAIRIAVDVCEGLAAGGGPREPAAALRCMAALLLLVGPPVEPGTVRAIFPLLAVGGATQTEVAIRALGDELVDVLAAQQILPDWMTQLIGSGERLLALVVSGRVGAATEDAALVAGFARALLQLLEGPAWGRIAADLPPDVRPAVAAPVRVLDDFCADTAGPRDARTRHLREGVSVCLLTLVGQPLARIIEAVADTGLRAAPLAFRRLADAVDVGRFPPDLSWSWEQIGEAGVGVAVGAPSAALLRRTAGTIDNWCDTVMPEELAFLTRSLRLGGVCERIAIDGSAKAVSDFKAAFLPELARHTAQHILNSIAFGLREGIELIETLLSTLVDTLVRSLEVSAIAAFKAFEDSIRAAESAVGGLQARADELERELARQQARLANELRSVAVALGAAADDIEDRLTSLLVDSALGLGQGRGVDRQILEGLVDAAIGAASGGISRGVRDTTQALSQLLQVSADGLAAVAASPNAPRGLRGLLESATRIGSMPRVAIPIVVPIPNPLLPGILPDIRVELFSIELPSEIVGQLAVTAMFDALGAGPLLDTLDVTVASLQTTRIALDQTHALVSGARIDEQRAALSAAEPEGPLAVEFLRPEAGAATAVDGEVAFRVAGANMSFVRPRSVGLPTSIRRRVVVRVNGRDVTDDVEWEVDATSLSGTFRFTSRMAAPGTVFVGSPVSVVVAVTEGTGADSASGSRVFVPPALPQSLVVSCIQRDPSSGASGIQALGGVDALGNSWTMRVTDALTAYDRGTRLWLAASSRAATRRRVAPARTRTGRRYLRASGAGSSRRLSDLPPCP